MNEEFLQYTWKHGLFAKDKLVATTGESITIVSAGQWNSDSGPDFFNASLKIDDTLWAGNVEVHINSSDWLKHNHQNNEAYNNVILHVVFNNDIPVSLPNGNKLPTLILVPDADARSNYENLIDEKTKPACAPYLQNIDRIYLQSTIDAMLVNRIKQKTDAILKTMEMVKNSWNETFYQHLAINFGFKTNALPFEMLTRSLPLSIVAKHTNNLHQLEALLFGQSGLLNEQLLGDDYFLALRDEYHFLAKKYKLKGIESHNWKFMRLRPANFPTIRLAQFAALFPQSEALFSKLTELNTPEDIRKLFKIKASEYWETHYRFNQQASKKTKWIGESSLNNILINTVVPFLYLYGERQNKEILKQRAINLLESLPPEKNKITESWKTLGINAENAYETQALIELKNNYCETKKCLHCQIGAKLINKK
ncbi:MAG: DUF2851 family protein [Prolixibacteraceae bacterium]|jgi:hypothetical protein|nr:DUF2851 family protein [Prolixibacteraceae bacterium]